MAMTVWAIRDLRDSPSTPLEGLVLFIVPIVAFGALTLSYWLLRCFESRRTGRRILPFAELVLLPVPFICLWGWVSSTFRFGRAAEVAISALIIAAIAIGGRLFARPVKKLSA